MRSIEKYVAKASEEIGISITEGLEIADGMFEDIKSYIEDKRAPAISIQNMFKIRPTKKKIINRIKFLIKKRRKGGLTKKEFWSEYIRLRKIQRRIYLERKTKAVVFKKWERYKDHGFEEEINERLKKIGLDG